MSGIDNTLRYMLISMMTSLVAIPSSADQSLYSNNFKQTTASTQLLAGICRILATFISGQVDRTRPMMELETYRLHAEQAQH